MDDDFSDLAALLRETDRPSDEAFVTDMEWLIRLDAAYAEQRRAMVRRWAVDAASAVAIALICYVIAATASGAPAPPQMLSLPLLAAAVVPAFWLLAKASSAPA